MDRLRTHICLALALLMAWSLYGFVLPAYAEEIGTAVTVLERDFAAGGGSPDEALPAAGMPSGEVVATQVETAAEESSAEEADAGADASGEDAAPEAHQTVYAEGRIHVATLDQLRAIGMNAEVRGGDDQPGSFGTGEVVTDTLGTPVTYASGAAYYLENDIAIPADGTWTLPDGFSGSFAGPADADGGRVYDEATDTVYIQNPYQLDILSSEGRSEMPVMTGDAKAETFGSGQLVYRSDGSPVNYDTSHTYVLSAAFTAERGALTMLESQASTGNEALVNGRDYFGQVTKEIGDTTYVLIGDRQQLDAINNASTDHVTHVCKPVYKVHQTREKLTDDWVTDESQTELVYPGDADLVEGVTVNGVGNSNDFSNSKLYDRAEVGHVLSSKDYDYRDLGTDDSDDSSTRYARDVWCTMDDSGNPNPNSHANDDVHAGTLTYTKDGNYIVFRDIDMTKGDVNEVSYGTLSNGDWKPLMFTGAMYGCTDVGKLTASDDESLATTTDLRPTISNFNVRPLATVELSKTRYDISANSGVGTGFFGTIAGEYTSDLLSEPCVVQNLLISHGTVDNECVNASVDVTVVSGLLTAVGKVLGWVLDNLLRVLIGGNKSFTFEEMLESLLNSRAKDPTTLATGAFAGCIRSNATVKDCAVVDVTVKAVASDFETGGSGSETSSKIVGTGGFVGHVEGETQYSGLSNVLGDLVKVLSALLNLIPGIGLGDLVDVLLSNAISLGNLVPTGYTAPTIAGCVADGVRLDTGAAKIGVGGFAGSVVGTRLNSCVVRNMVGNDDGTSVRAAIFGGGFVGVARDAIIRSTLSGLGVDFNVVKKLHPQSELLSCSIASSNVTVSGGGHLGGFVGCLANSYAIDDSVDESCSISVSGTGDYAGGFVGRGQLGSMFTLSDYIVTSADLLGTVTGLVTSLLGSGTGQTLLDVGGVAPSAVVGVRVLCPVEVTSEGSYVGGLAGWAEGMYVLSSSAANITRLNKYSGDKPADDAPQVEERDTELTQLRSVHGKSYAGGLAGYLTSGDIGGLLGNTLGVGQYLGFTVEKTSITGVSDAGYTVTADEDYAAGGIGWAVGGSVQDVILTNLASVGASNYAGGFVGATGPGDLVGAEGINLQLFNISLLSVNNLLSLAQSIRTTYQCANVTGISDGFTVTAKGERANGGTTIYQAGGWAGTANSIRVVDSHVANLRSVTANTADGIAGGYLGTSAAGGLASVAKDTELLKLISVNELVSAVPYLVPSYDGCSVGYVDGGFVRADTAGGFAGEFQSGKVNTYVADGKNPIKHVLDEKGKETSELESYVYAKGTSDQPWSVYNLSYVRGGTYAGGWGGKVYSGALANVGNNGLSVLGGLTNVSISATDILSVANVYVPIVKYAGVNTSVTAGGTDTSNPGLKVFAAHIETEGQPATKGYAGGFIGYGSGVQVSYCDVNKLRYGNVSEPTALTNDDTTAYARTGIYPDVLESSDGSTYMGFGTLADDLANVPYAVAGATYAGGFIGHMNVGSAASVGGGLQLLGDSISLTNILSALSAVVSTVEHSNVYGATGGFSVVASTHINLGDRAYDSDGKGYAGGFAGKVSGGHIQDSNADNFAYVIGEVAAGGYAGEMEPGSVVDLLEGESTISFFKEKLQVADLSNVASLVQDFVPTIRNSETTCIPCGGAVRAQSSATQDAVRGMAGGYVGHNKGGQIWGNSTKRWNGDAYTGTTRECAAIRIRSVFGQEYAGGFCGLMECGSTAQTGGLSLLGGLIDLSNLVGALQVVYPTIRGGAVYGPLHGITEGTWDSWKDAVGSHGGFASELVTASFSDLSKYEYGTHVVAGRHTYNANAQTKLAGTAGGFVGSMHGGVIGAANNGTKSQLFKKDSSTSGSVGEVSDDETGPCHVEDAKLVLGMRAAGGFVGEMQTKGLADFGSVSILGLDLNLGSLINVASIFVPAISTSGATGYQKGLRVAATGVADTTDAARQAGVGCAGGFVGASYGGQIGIRDSAAQVAGTTTSGTWARNLKEVRGTRDVGGFVGRSTAAAVLTADTENASDGYLQKLLDSLISTPGSLADALDATIATIKYAEVTASDSKWGIVVDGSYTEDGQTRYAEAAGGFAGSLEASVLGKARDASCTLKVDGLRGVVGGYYAGGFFGLADVGSIASVGGSSSSGSTTSILSLIEAGNVNVLDAFRTYIHHASVTGVADGIRVYARQTSSTGTMSTYTAIGSAGGFGGGLMNGTVDHSSVSGLNYVEAPYYAAGFTGYMGKGGGITASEASVSSDSVVGKILSKIGLDLSLNAQVLDIVGSTVSDCSVAGFSDGFVTKATTPQEASSSAATADLTGSCSAGFAGFADVSQIENCTVTAYKLAESPQIAAGFLGRGSIAFVADLDVNSGLTNFVVSVVNVLVKALYADKLERADLINLETNNELLGLKVLADGDLLYVNMLGIKISVALSKNDPEYGGSQDAAIITIGSSTIKLPCTSEGLDTSGGTPNLTVNLIEANRTMVKSCSVTGIVGGYDVLAGGASQTQTTNDAGVSTTTDTVGTDSLGYAGGFVAYNDNGYFSHDTAALCDVVLGTTGLVGPFVGVTRANSRTVEYLEGGLQTTGVTSATQRDNGNTFSVYRSYDGSYTKAVTSAKADLANAVAVAADGTTGGSKWNRYQVTHGNAAKYQTSSSSTNLYSDSLKSLEGAKQSNGDGTTTMPLGAYELDGAKAVLMADTPVTANTKGNTVEPDDLKDPCDESFTLTVNKVWEGDLAGLMGARPDSVTVYVWQVDATNEGVAAGTPPAELVTAGAPADGIAIASTFALQLNSKDNAQAHTEAWKAQLADLPVAYEVATAGGGSEVHYYHYYVSEVDVSRYTTSYEVVSETASVTVTNRYNDSLIPDLGGSGVGMGLWILLIAGALVIAWRIWRQRRDEHEGVGGTDS